MDDDSQERPSPALVVTGLGRDDVARKIRALIGTRATVSSMTDVEGALAVRDGRADYFVGVCQSGAGGALAMAIAFLGKDRCVTVCTLGRAPDPLAVAQAVGGGKIAFGISSDQAERAVQLLVDELFKKLI